MRRELARCLRQPLYWAVLGAGLTVRLALAWLDCRYRPDQFWIISADFWSKTGSVTEAFLIVLVLIRLFSIDRECGTRPIILSTAHGRKRLLRDRLAAGTAAAVVGTFLLALGNGVVTAALGWGLPYPAEWMGGFLTASALALAGSEGFFLVCACVCDLTQNHPAAMCLCGLPFGLSCFINVDMVRPPEPLWLLRYGFFSELMRGRALPPPVIVLAAWYLVLCLGVLCLTVRKRKESGAL